MDCCVTRVLSADEARGTAMGLTPDAFADGRATASGFARELKHNLQATGSQAPAAAVLAALDRNPDLRGFAHPRRILPPMFNRYEIGMTYGRHVDAAVMGKGGALRTDYSVTVFLSDPLDYDGGELIIDLAGAETAIKLDIGEAVIYPANTVHEVRPVTRGVRVAAITWVQSAVSDPRLRALLSDIFALATRLGGSGDAELALQASRIYQDALRYAVDP